jgi:hypothetical protein
VFEFVGWGWRLGRGGLDVGYVKEITVGREVKEVVEDAGD